MDAIKLVVKRVEEERDELKKKVERLERTVECFAKNSHHKRTQTIT